MKETKRTELVGKKVHVLTTMNKFAGESMNIQQKKNNVE